MPRSVVRIGVGASFWSLGDLTAAGLFDAGVHAVKLEELERRLRNDLMHEAMAWGGRLLLHRDIPRQGHDTKRPSADGKNEDDITTNDDEDPSNAITAFWDSAGESFDLLVNKAVLLSCAFSNSQRMCRLWCN